MYWVLAYSHHPPRSSPSLSFVKVATLQYFLHFFPTRNVFVQQLRELVKSLTLGNSGGGVGGSSNMVMGTSLGHRNSSLPSLL